jgi:lipoprotein-releasing system ATP-binding protein
LVFAENIQKSYGNVAVLKGIDLLIQKSEIVSIVGASGAGKSTLLHILGTLDKVDTGKVRIGNTDIHTLTGNKLAEFRNQKIGFVFQFHNLLPEFTVLENVCLPAYLAKKNKIDAQKKATELLEFLGLKDRLTHLPAQLSGGEQQRTAVARALINTPEVIFADEPSGNLDTHNAQELHQLFFSLRKEFGQTFVIVTHNPLLADMSDRKIVLEKGKVISE